MTKQKFYELTVIKTLKTARFDDRNPYYSIAKYLDKIEDLSFNQIMMKLELKGVVSIPRKENFKKWGISYLCQLFGFVVNSNDVIFQRLFFKFLNPFIHKFYFIYFFFCMIMSTVPFIITNIFFDFI